MDVHELSYPPGTAPAPAKLPELLSAADVAVYFGKSTRTLRRWSSPTGGTLRKVRIKGAVYYRSDDILALVEGSSGAS